MDAEHPSTMPDVTASVVVPYYQDQQGLNLLLAALELQSVPVAEMVVADDGSAIAPFIGQRPFPVRVVRQQDEGFRAAAARNLGAREASGEYLVFLDGDMIPEPDYLGALLQAMLEVSEETLVVGRRRHADLDGWDAGQVRTWLSGGGPSPRPLGDPQWLTDGYRGSDDLRRADDRSYRFVISAVMAVPRQRFLELGGFVEFSGYGGEDWEFAHRWRHHGGRLRHAPGAVAWQDGTDFSGRHDAEQRRRIKDHETLRLAPLLPVPGARDPRLLWRVPFVAVLADVSGLTTAQALDFLASLVDGSDAAVWVEGLPESVHAQLSDPRIRRAGDGDPWQSTWLVQVHRSGALSGATLTEVVTDAFDDAPSGVTKLPDLVVRAAAGDPAVTLGVRHVPTGACRHLILAPGLWADLPEPTRTLEEHWSRGV